jgi:hypothetical protein
MEVIIIVIIIVISLIAQLYLMNIYNVYKKYDMKNDNTGFDVARKILDNYDLNNIYITEVKGILTDHYYYPRKVVRLSKNVFHGTSILSTSIAAFESAHAIMDKEKNRSFIIRKRIEPLVNFLTVVGIILIASGLFFDIKKLITIGTIFALIYLIFQLVTLPVEFNAARRAMDELLENSLISKKDNKKVKAVLSAMTFINIGSFYRTISETFSVIYNFGKNS